MGVTLFFLEKNLMTFFSHRPLESDDLFSCRLLTTPIFPSRLSSVLSKFGHKKIIIGRVSPPWRVSPGAVPPSDATAFRISNCPL